VLKDAFDLGLDEIAQILSTSVGAVKAALHRGRGKLTEPDPDVPRTPAPGALDEFCAAFNARDLDRLTALLLDHATVEVVGASTFYGATSARGTVLTGMLFGSQRMAAPADGGRGDGMDPRFAQGALPLCGTDQQRVFEVLAQAPQRVAGRGLRQPDPRRRPGHAAFREQRIQQPQQVEVELVHMHDA